MGCDAGIQDSDIQQAMRQEPAESKNWDEIVYRKQHKKSYLEQMKQYQQINVVPSVDANGNSKVQESNIFGPKQ